MRRCKSCGRLVDDNIPICPHCGKSTSGSGMESGSGRDSVPYAFGSGGRPTYPEGPGRAGREGYPEGPGGWREVPRGGTYPEGPGGWHEGMYGSGYPEGPGGWREAPHGSGYPEGPGPWHEGPYGGGYSGRPTDENKGLDPGFIKKLVIGIVALCLVLVFGVVGIVMFMRSQRTVDLEKVVQVNYEGYDGFGTAYAGIDNEKLNSALVRAMGRRYQEFSNDNLNFYGDAYKLYNAYWTLCNETKCTCNKTENLKNGDRVHVDIKYGNDVKQAARTLGIIIKGSGKDDKVKGLEKTNSYDPFEKDVEVVFSGSSPYASADVNYIGEYDGIYDEMFKLDKKENIKIGDTLTITLDTTELTPEITRPMGYEIGKTEGKHKVVASEVNYYIANAGGLSDDVLQVLKPKAEKAILDYFDDIKEYVSSGDPEYQAAYVFMSKYQDSWDANNCVDLVYKVSVSSKEGSFKTQDIYIPIQFENVIVQTDGEIDGTNASGPLGETDLEYDIKSYWPDKVKGYKTKPALDKGLSNDMGNNYNGSRTKGFLD